ncbi:hypothetical protein KSX_08820 [Ktedonospora formicarum]|uniref:Uncharacterized protein n=1 Tax=Ktedonospora formicarum TaxID=2778364 RepID=A0A8J3HS99_9CHLR|nr:hypothetical protein KSX_08820 [Ktedonospora formicarum]
MEWKTTKHVYRYTHHNNLGKARILAPYDPNSAKEGCGWQGAWVNCNIKDITYAILSIHRARTHKSSLASPFNP